MRIIGKIFLWLIGAVAILALVLIVNTLLSPVSPVTNATGSDIKVDTDTVARHLSEAIQIKTVSTSDRDERDMAQFQAFIDWMETTYPRFHTETRRTVVNGYSLLFEWAPDGASGNPVMLTGHYDVVPADQKMSLDISRGKNEWNKPPFSGEIADGFVWGRGALDDKGQIIVMIEAAEILMAQNFKPKRPIHFTFGHDEEIGGIEGAAQIVERQKAAGVTYEWSLDEGSMVLSGIIDGVDPLIASVNVAEKGNLTVDLVAKASGGHSSLPPPSTAIGDLAEAIEELVDKPVPGGLTGLSADTFEAISGHMPFINRVLFANQWLFGPIIERALSGSAATNATIRTTTAPTMLSGSVKENVLPSEAIATVNFRLHPRDTVETVVEHIRRSIDNDEIEIRVRDGGFPASPVSAADAQGFLDISASARTVFDNLVVVPGLTIAVTDTRHWLKISENSYRFTPFVFDSSDIPRLHGKNERVSIENLELGVKFYGELMQKAGG